MRLNICEYCGKVFYSEREKLYCSEECKARACYTKYDVTLCWSCKKSTGFCSWSEDFIPVEGWKAIPTKIKATSSPRDNRFIDSFLVRECPLFERG